VCVFVCPCPAPGPLSGCGFPFPVPVSHLDPNSDDICSVFVVDLDKGLYGLGMGLIDGLVSLCLLLTLVVNVLCPYIAITLYICSKTLTACCNIGSLEKCLNLHFCNALKKVKK